MEAQAKNQDIQGDEYNVRYDAATSTVFFEGSLSLPGLEDFTPVINLLNAVLDSAPPRLILNLRQLEFLNSSGISILSRFVIKARGQSETTLMLHGSETIIWQKRSLRNLQRLMPSIELEWV
ncbi:hypothetical protein GFS31_38970 [Leptolyngbya sp. BL0902]|uniref:slr1659 superfamily regulator n=1 Tax=Leptolyngbya sp. BL0902 TaxID=1115757 RepID=UPI0018E7DADF|nr:hypothetical protein [Leptolyngbya sp. BL0902]QQE67185.1 hypothetical protein GFS31_38970 [Leptolyngbya sp. BL0902]